MAAMEKGNATLSHCGGVGSSLLPVTPLAPFGANHSWAGLLPPDSPCLATIRPLSVSEYRPVLPSGDALSQALERDRRAPEARAGDEENKE